MLGCLHYLMSWSSTNLGRVKHRKVVHLRQYAVGVQVKSCLMLLSRTDKKSLKNVRKARLSLRRPHNLTHQEQGSIGEA
jgi:hypothetical protein